MVIMNPVRPRDDDHEAGTPNGGPHGGPPFRDMTSAPTSGSHGTSQPRTTLPAFRHEVQTFSFRTVPGATCARTGWMFGSHRRWVRRWEWDTFIPKPGPLPHTSHTAATPNTPIDVVRSATGPTRATLRRPGARRAFSRLLWSARWPIALHRH